MKVVLQRVARAEVRVDDEVVGRIGRGLLLLVGFHHEDGPTEIAWMAARIRGLRIFPDEAGKMNLSLDEIEGELLVVSQFTLYGDASKGRRPSFVDAAPPDIAIPLYEAFVQTLRDSGCSVATGQFGATMDVDLVNEGPVTLILER